MKNELYHHGILGQKWGRKNGPPYPLTRSKMSAAERKNYSPDYLEAHSGKSVSELSTAELNRINARLQAEQNYLRLTATKTKGKKFMDGVEAVNKTANSVFKTVGTVKKGKAMVDLLSKALLA